jgi:hypothetical protein
VHPAHGYVQSDQFIQKLTGMHRELAQSAICTCRIKNCQLAWSFHSWMGSCSEQKRLRQVMCSIVLRLSKRALAAAFDTWSEYAVIKSVRRL